jgi:hypothetical protein
MRKHPESPPPRGIDADPARASAGSLPAPRRVPTAGVALRTPRLPSIRVTAALAAGMLALGVLVGAAIGPAPDASFAGSRLPMLLPSLAALAVAGASQGASSPPAPAPVATGAMPTVTPSAGAGGARVAGAGGPASPRSTSASPTSPSSSPSSPSPAPAGGRAGAGQATLPAVKSVWLIELSGTTFAQALAQPAAAPYIDRQAVPAGALLSGWYALDAGAFASETALLASSPPQLLDTIVQPPCPEGSAGAQCAPETAGALAAADAFLQQTVPPITSSAAYREHGLIVVTFAAVGSAAASGLPAGAATATLTSQPPVGVLLLSPFSSAGTRAAGAFNPASPRQSIEKLMHR